MSEKQVLRPGIGDADKHSSRSNAPVAAARIKNNKAEAGVRASANFRKTEPMHWERINARPCSPAIVAPLQSIVTRPEVQARSQVRINGEALAQPAAIFVAAHAEGRRKHFPGFAAIPRSQNRSAITAIHSRGKVNNIRVTRIRRDAFDTEITRFSNRILQGFPTASCGIPSVGTAHVSSEIRETALSTAEHDAGRANPPPPTLTLRQT